MKTPPRPKSVDLLIITYTALVAEAEETIRLIETGYQYQRNSIVDITAETLASATRTRDALREGMRLLKQTSVG